MSIRTPHSVLSFPASRIGVILDKTGVRIAALLLLLTTLALLPLYRASAQNAEAPTSDLIKSLNETKFDLNLRYRFESVDDDGFAKDANASTLRTTAGLTTGKFHDFFTRLQVQDVREVGLDDFDDGTGRNPVRAQYPLVADPEETDLLEAYLGFTGFANTTMKVGRQIVTYREAPNHRFIGTVLWRQNWQNHDAFTLVNTSLANTTFSYAYSWNVNRIFTDEAVNRVRANFDSNSHFLNIEYKGLPYGVLEGYTYLLDFDNSPATSSSTFGVRFSGNTAMSAAPNAKIIYALEYARQDDYADNPLNFDEYYFLGEIGAAFVPGHGVDSFTIKFDYELLTGNGAASFNTPLATLHVYQGWADRFLTTPVNGLQDIYVTGGAVFKGVNLSLSYHDFSSDRLDYDYGTEFDAQATKALNKNFTVGLKYATYDADPDLPNVGATALDVDKFWAWVQFVY
ncbi:MAG: hypothetical protein EPO31_02875 [Gammaproteobacteria bacterium]|nr:MAG: hypothetical protein EPO31_02875 [Gammaproteobacteria bacterium]